MGLGGRGSGGCLFIFFVNMWCCDFGFIMKIYGKWFFVYFDDFVVLKDLLL